LLEMHTQRETFKKKIEILRLSSPIRRMRVYVYIYIYSPAGAETL